MTSRGGEKVGWVGGWLGGFAWVALLSIILLVQGKAAAGLIGLLLTVSAVLLVLWLAPWRHPTTPYWKLMLPAYAVLFVSVAWALWSHGGPGGLGLSWWSLSLLLPLLMPLGTTGRRRWSDPGA